MLLEACGYMFLNYLGTYLGAELLGHMEIMFNFFRIHLILFHLHHYLVN